MNKLIIIGNGFDLDHGYKTSYNDFINWVFLCAIKKDKNKTQLVSTTDKLYNETNWEGDEESFAIHLNQNSVSYLEPRIGYLTKANSHFHTLLKRHHLEGWVDIEKEYYQGLLIRNKQGGNRKENILHWNNAFN